MEHAETLPELCPQHSRQTLRPINSLTLQGSEVQSRFHKANSSSYYPSKDAGENFPSPSSASRGGHHPLDHRPPQVTEVCLSNLIPRASLLHPFTFDLASFPMIEALSLMASHLKVSSLIASAKPRSPDKVDTGPRLSIRTG